MNLFNKREGCLMGRCSATRSDGKPCRNAALRGGVTCRYHGQAVLPVATVEAELVPTGTPGEQRAATPAEAIRLNWYVNLLHNLRKLAEVNGTRIPILEDELSEGEPYLSVDGDRLPAAALLVFTEDGKQQVALGAVADNAIQLRADFGVSPVTLPSGVADPVDYVFRLAVERNALRAEPVSGSDTPFIAFKALTRAVVVSAHPDIPTTADGLPDLRVLVTRREEWSALTERAGNTPAPDRLPTLIQFPGDRIHKATVEALSRVDDWKQEEGFSRATRPSVRRGDFSMLFGLKEDPGEAIWQFLLKRGEAAIKAHYALWARIYEQTGGEPGKWAVINLNQFCADLGFTKHKKGGYKREQRQEAVRLLEALTALELVVYFTPPGKKARQRRLRGPLWQRGFIAEESDQYSDLFGQIREGDPTLWDPVGFAFGPGAWFSDPVWRRNNRYLGQIGAGLLRLSTHTDQVAIRIGGYLGTLARIGQYRSLRLRITTLLERIGMADHYPKDPKRLQAAVEKGIDKLVAVGVVAGWRYTENAPSDPEEESSQVQQDSWRTRVLEVEWPEELTAMTPRLEDAQRRRIEAAAPKALPAGNRSLNQGRGGNPTRGCGGPHPRLRETPPEVAGDRA
jgi:hypothetical protein